MIERITPLQLLNRSQKETNNCQKELCEKSYSPKQADDLINFKILKLWENGTPNILPPDFQNQEQFFLIQGAKVLQ